MVKILLLAFIPIVCLFSQNPSIMSQPKRCEAITKNGTRCKNMAVNGTKYCQVHQAKSPTVQQCKARTKSGARCSRAAKVSGYCLQHYRMHANGKL